MEFETPSSPAEESGFLVKEARRSLVLQRGPSVVLMEFETPSSLAKQGVNRNAISGGGP
jgi:hypothetical protein